MHPEDTNFSTIQYFLVDKYILIQGSFFFPYVYSVSVFELVSDV